MKDYFMEGSSGVCVCVRNWKQAKYGCFMHNVIMLCG